MNWNETARLVANNGEQPMLKGVSIHGVLRGLLFEAVVEQSFFNPGETSAEVDYTFPLPWGAVLLGVDVVLGGKRLSGAVVEKKEAEGMYEDALAGGDAAIMLEKNHDRSYSANLGNLAPQEDCQIRLRYGQVLNFEQGGLRLAIPTVIAPRYGDDVRDGGLQPHQAVQHDLLAEYPFSISVELHGELAAARVASPSHAVAVATGSDAEAPKVTVSLQQSGSLDRDFVLVIDQLAHPSLAAVAKDWVSENGVAVLASFHPKVAPYQAGERQPCTSVKVLVDCSGSMAGDSMDAAKRALKHIVAKLSEGDRFSLSRFGSTVEHRATGMWTVSPRTQESAGRWVEALDADMGGTAMAEALTSTFALRGGGGSAVLLITDGQVADIDATLRAAQASGDRLFVAGIGSSPEQSHLHRLAEATGGACDFLAPGEAVEPAVLRMFARLRSPQLGDLRLEWTGETQPTWVSPIRAAVFDGDTVHVYATFYRPPTGEVRLIGTQGAGGATMLVGTVGLDMPVQPHDVLSRMAATARVGSLASSSEPSARETATILAVDYQIVTDFTNFILVYRRDEDQKSFDMPELHQVRHMVPAGWGGMSSVLAGRLRSIDEPHAVEYRVSEKSARDGTDDSYRSVSASIPVFCRIVDRSPDPDGPIQDLMRNRRYWSPTEPNPGWTPLGLSEWLRLTPRNQWPTSCVELSDKGLPPRVGDWLERTMTASAGKEFSESTVVATFLYLMSQRETYARVYGLADLLAWFLGIVQRLRGGAPEEETGTTEGVDVGLLEAMTNALKDMTATEWPELIGTEDGLAEEKLDERNPPAI